MNSPSRILVFCGLLALGNFHSLHAQVNVLTYHNDNARTGQNTNENLLTPANVNTSSFRKLFTTPVDGYVYAQPLYVSGLSIPGKGTHNVVFIATEHNSVYAFDADSNLGGPGGLLWHVNLGRAPSFPYEFGNQYSGFNAIVPEVGTTSTPVIDLASETIYVDALTHDGAHLYNHRIHALNILNGQERPNSPVVVAASVPGQGYDNVNGVVSFNAMQQLQRSALTLAGGVLYVAYAAYDDTDPYHGWVIGFQASTLQQLTNYVFNDSPNSSGSTSSGETGRGGIWMSGNGLAVDDNTNLYVVTGNGAFDGTSNSIGTEFGDSVLKLSSANGLEAADFFTPFNQSILAGHDDDLGSGGPLLLPDSVGSPAHPHLMTTCGKEGAIYLLDRDNLGRYNPFSNLGVLQEVDNANNGTWSSPAYFNNLLYFLGSGDVCCSDVMRAFQVSNGYLTPASVSATTSPFGFPGATPSITADGTNNAIVWAIQTDGFKNNSPAFLHAYNAYDLSQELYNSGQAGGRDRCGAAVKFVVPTIANGKVYVGGAYSFSVFGLTSNSTPLVQISGLGTVSPNYDRSRLVPGKRYTIVAIPRAGYVFNGWSGSIAANSRVLTFTMEEGLDLEANFVPNPFGPAVGNYQGLFSDPNGVDSQSSGLLNATVTKTGAFSAKVQQGASRYSISGQFLGSGVFSNSISRRGQSPISIQLQLALAGGNALYGNLGNGTWNAQLSAFLGVFSKTNPAPQANERFTFLLPGGGDPASLPQGDGFGAFKVDSLGRVTLSGMLSDGSKFSESALLSEQGQFPLYSAPYLGKGELFGWLAFTNGQTVDLAGQVIWSKAAQATTKLYPAGFTNSIAAFGSQFLFTNKTPVLNLAPGEASFTGGNLSASITNQISLSSNNKINGPGKFALSINPLTGLFKGTVLPSSPGKMLSFNGTVIQKQNYGSGFFLGPSQSGRVFLGP